MIKFSIVTPSRNQLEFLKRCIASVRDQTGSGVEVHHHIQDACSVDGTPEWLAEIVARQQANDNYQLTFTCETDEGMYDALNKGFQYASGDLFAWLNCDEQYLPATLRKVARFFAQHPRVDLVVGDALLVGSDGHLLTYRKNPPLRLSYVLADHLYAQSAGIFFRRRIFDSGIRFNTCWRAVGDCDFFVRVLQSGCRVEQMRDYLAACVMTGDNLSRQRTGREELARYRRQCPAVYRLGRPLWNTALYLEKLLRGGYSQTAPLVYDLYVDEIVDVRRELRAESPGSRFVWGHHE